MRSKVASFHFYRSHVKTATPYVDHIVPATPRRLRVRVESCTGRPVARVRFVFDGSGHIPWREAQDHRSALKAAKAAPRMNCASSHHRSSWPTSHGGRSRRKPTDTAPQNHQGRHDDLHHKEWRIAKSFCSAEGCDPRPPASAHALHCTVFPVGLRSTSRKTSPSHVRHRSIR